MEKVRIDIVPMGVTPNAHASQYDVARVIRFLLYNQGTAYTLAGTETITVKMTKPDGTEETVSVTNTSSDYVDFVTTDGLLDQAGLYPCEISIVNGTDVIGSKNFNLRVEMDPYNGKGLRVVTVGPADICTFEPTISEPLVNVKCELTPSLDGYTAVNLTACGVNLWDEEWELGGISTVTGVDFPNNNQIRSIDYIKVFPNTTYYNKGYTLAIIGYDENKNFVEFLGNISVGTFTIPSGVHYIRFCRTATTYNNDISINYPSTDTTYHAYTGNTYAIALGDTYYGGTLDVTRGKLHITHEYFEFDGSNDENWLLQSINGYGIANFAIVVTPKFNNSGLSLCNRFEKQTTIISQTSTEGYYLAASETIYIRILATNASTVADMRTWLSNNNVQFVCELATPIEIDLGSGTAVTASAGVNNVFADCGQTEVKYLTIEV